MHFPPKFQQKPPPLFFHGAFAPSFIWRRRPCLQLVDPVSHTTRSLIGHTHVSRTRVSPMTEQPSASPTIGGPTSRTDWPRAAKNPSFLKKLFRFVGFQVIQVLPTYGADSVLEIQLSVSTTYCDKIADLVKITRKTHLILKKKKNDTFLAFWHRCKMAATWLYATVCSFCRGQHADVNI